MPAPGGPVNDSPQRRTSAGSEQLILLTLYKVGSETTLSQRILSLIGLRGLR